jgi:acyl carrier protein
MSIKQDVKTYILENYLFTDDDSQLSDNDSFLEKGILDSTGILEVIYFIEDEYGIKVEDDEMIPENLDSVESLVVFVQHKQGSKAS